MKKFINIFFKIIIILLFILTIFFAYMSIFHKDILLSYLDSFKLLVANLGYWNYVIIFLFGFIESFPLLGIAVPGQMVLIVIAGFFGALGGEYIFYSILCAGFGAVLGNYVGYLMGIKYGDSFFKKYGNWIGVGQTDVKYMKKGIEKHGWLFVIFGKFHNMFRAFIPFIAGSSKMNSLKFTLSNIFGSFLRAIAMVFLGVFFVNNAETILENIGKIFLAIIVVFLLYIYFFKRDDFMKYWDEKNKEIEEILKNSKIVK